MSQHLLLQKDRSSTADIISRHSATSNYSFADAYTETLQSGPLIEKNTKYLGTIDDMTGTSNSAASSDRSAERHGLLLIPDLSPSDEKSDSGDSEIAPPSSVSMRPQAPEQAFFRPPGYMDFSHIQYDPVGGDDGGAAGGEMHPYFQAGLDIARGCAMILCAVVTIIFVTVHALTEVCFYLPCMYQDPLARKRDVIETFVGGCESAVKYFFLGVFDGVTGFFMLPYIMAQKQGATGLVLGILMGFGGIILKPSGGGLALVGDPLFGVYKELFGLRISIKWKLRRSQRWQRNKNLSVSDLSSV